MNWRGLELIGGGIAIASSFLICKLDRDIKNADESFKDSLKNFQESNRNFKYNSTKDILEEIFGIAADSNTDNKSREDDKTIDLYFGDKN